MKMRGLAVFIAASLLTGVSEAAAQEAPATGKLHRLVGTIDRIDGTIVLLRLRNGRLQRIDDALALASDHYSYPLFVGKTVAVEGNLDARGTFKATSLVNIAKADESAAADR